MITQTRNDYKAYKLDQAYQKRHKKETWKLARVCTNTGKGTKRRWQNCPITSRPNTAQTETLLMKPANEGGISAKSFKATMMTLGTPPRRSIDSS